MGHENDSLGDRMKWYERRYTEESFLPMNPVMARIDGRSFHTFTRGLERPYDKRLSDLMVETTKYLVDATNARSGYTQSDEITLVWLSEDWESEIFFGGKLLKMTSLLAGIASAFFNKKLPDFLPEKANELPVFDSRVWQLPTEYEASNCFIWRELDATRNSIQMAARAYFSHNECNKKNCSELQEMLFQKGINWNDYPAFFKRGSYVRRRSIEKVITPEELEQLPPKHAARNNPDLKVRRSAIMVEEFPPLKQLVNRDEVLLHGAEPITRKAEDEHDSTSGPNSG